MAAEVSKPAAGPPAEAHAVPKESRHELPSPEAVLAADIDDLRRKMAETFLKEASFTSDPVIMISRQLDLKINEYMRQSYIHRKKAR